MTVLSDSTASVIAAHLIAEGIFTDPDAVGSWPLSISHLPNNPDNAGAIYDTTGLKDGLLMEGTVIYKYGLQMLIRSFVYGDGRTKANAVASEMESITDDSVVIGATTYTLQNISQVGSVLFLGIEQGSKRRNLFSINFLATIGQT